MNHNDVLLILGAADTAAKWHAGQRRKGAAGEPYLNHLVEVAAMVAEATDGRDPELVAAALLHDAIEDQPITRDMIAERFGEDVASLVVECTDDKSLPYEERKRLQIALAPYKSPRAQVIKLADKTSNLISMVESPPAGWSTLRRAKYIVWSRHVVRALGGGMSRELQIKFWEASNRAEKVVVTEHYAAPLEQARLQSQALQQQREAAVRRREQSPLRLVLNDPQDS